MAVGPLEPVFYAELLDGLGLDPAELPGQYDREGWPELRRRFGGAFAERSRAEWEEVFDGTDACVTPVLSLTEAPEHPHNVARGVFGGFAGRRLPNPTPRVGADHPSTLADARALGVDTNEVLAQLGYDDAFIQELRGRGVVS
jgi:alpha-methylacyl-CoA racemase